MDFSRVQLSDDDQAFLDEARAFLAEQVTEDVIRRDRETGDNFDEGVHLALGAAGYLHGEWHTEDDGGFSRVRRRLWELEKRRSHVPWVTMGTTSMVAKTVAAFGSPELRDEVLPRLERRCVSVLQPEMGHTGVTEFMRIGHYAQAHHLRVIPHATIGIGLFLAASLQASAALSAVTAHEFQHSIFEPNRRLLVGDMDCREGAYALPTGAGLGVEPSEEALRLLQR